MVRLTIVIKNKIDIGHLNKRINPSYDSDNELNQNYAIANKFSHNSLIYYYCTVFRYIYQKVMRNFALEIRCLKRHSFSSLCL